MSSEGLFSNYEDRFEVHSWQLEWLGIGRSRGSRVLILIVAIFLSLPSLQLHFQIRQANFKPNVLHRNLTILEEKKYDNSDHGLFLQTKIIGKKVKGGIGKKVAAGLQGFKLPLFHQ